MGDEDLAKKLETYQELAKENPGVDVNLLMMNALETSNKQAAEHKSHRWGYLISIGLPPLGLFLAVKYWMDGDDDSKQAAKICVLLTVVGIIMLFVFGKALFSTAGVTPQQIEQIKPSDIQQAIQ